jgi:hypothetical protein
MLVVWIGCCLLHRVALQAHPGLLPNYGLPMRFDELKHCVLDDKLAIDAALAVATYVREWTRAANLTLFSLRERVERDTTIKFARSFAEGNEAMRLRLQSEKIKAKERQEAGWEKVNGKKKQAIRKRQEIEDKKDEISLIKSRLLRIEREIELIESRSFSSYSSDFTAENLKLRRVMCF